MIKISSLFVVGILGTSIAFAQEEPPPPVEGWRLVVSGTTSSTSNIVVTTIYTNYAPGYYSFNVALETFRRVNEPDLGNTNPAPQSSPVWSADLSALEDTTSQVHYLGTYFANTGVSAFEIRTTKTMGAASQEFQYIPYIYNRFRALDYKTYSTEYTINVLP